MRNGSRPANARSRWSSCLWLVILLGSTIGCGTTRVTDTQRTATEQLLVSNAIDEAVSQLDFRLLAGKPVFFDPQYLDGTTDRGYLVSSLRQHLLACGCVLQEEKAKATYIVEARSGGVGTDRHSLLYGVPQMNVPAIVPGQPSAIPEIPLAKKTDQKAVAKIAVFAFNRNTGRPVFQSGVVQKSSWAKDTWVFGAGPFQRGSIRNGTEFAGGSLPIPFVGDKESESPLPPVVGVAQAAAWIESVPRDEKEFLRKNLPLLRQAVSAIAFMNLAAYPVSFDSLPPSAKPPGTLPVTLNPGGQAETEPSKCWSSGFGYKPDK